MNETTTNPLEVLANEHVQELLSTMKKNGLDGADLLGIVITMTHMEKELNTAGQELAAMRQELSELREAQSHPLKTALQNTADTLEKGIAEARARLGELKDNIVDGCKNAMAAFKDKGIVALNNLAGFFHIRQGLEAVKRSFEDCVRYDDAAIAKIAAVSAEYHEVGKHLKNLGRAMSGKEAVQQAKPMGRLAKLAQAPYQMERGCFQRGLRGADHALNNLERLEQAAAKRPSVLGNLQAMKEKAAQAAQDAPKPDRPRTQEAAI